MARAALNDHLSHQLAVLVDSENPQAATALAEQLQLQQVMVPPQLVKDFPYLLLTDEQGLALQQTGRKADGPVRVDFLSGGSLHRRHSGGGEMIVKAMGGSKQQRPPVLDATAGLGRDSFVLASWGFPVTLLERSLVVGLLLADGLARARQSDDAELLAIIDRMKLQQANSIDYLASLQGEQRPDVIYIDPMFPHTKKSALVKKEMRAFQAVLGPDQDSDELFAAAMVCAVHRVVVKRPSHADFIAAEKPTFSLKGKAMRFDVYGIKAYEK